MKRLSEIEIIGYKAVKQLREQKLQRGLPFMINSKNLPSNQCYLEYPNGSITIVQIIPSAKDFTVIKQLNSSEINLVRTEFNLFE
jgi:hypothetical protein